MPIEFKSKIKYVYQILNRPIEELKKLGFGNGVESVQEGTGIDIDNTDPSNPIVSVDLSTALPFIHLDGTTTGGQGNVTGVVDFDAGGSKGARIVFQYPNGDIIKLGGEYNDYPTIEFFNSALSQTLQLYMRGEDLILINDTTGQGTSNIIQSFDAFNNQRVLFGIDSNPIPTFPSVDAGRQVINWNSLAFISNGGSTQQSWSPIATYYFSDCCRYSQTGTSAPTEDVVFETQAGFMVTKTIAYQTTGHYTITYNVGTNWMFMPNPDKVKVMVTSGNNTTGVHISASVAQTSTQTIEVSIYTRGNSGAANGLLQDAFIDVYWYK